MAQIFLSLGSNMGNREKFLRAAIIELQESGVKIVRISPFYETKPVGMKPMKPEMAWFLNACVEGQAAAAPEELLKICLNIERDFGRKPNTHNRPRPIDIDLLFYDQVILHTPQLVIPHNELHRRRFVLLPLAEMAPNFQHPVLKKTIKELLSECADTAIVRAAHG